MTPPAADASAHRGLDGMILAAGLGSRLRPLTDSTPKALIRVGDVPMLERVARRLIAAGVDRLIINVHHHADQIRTFIEERDGFGVDVQISEERDRPLETGGGVIRAAPLFRRETPFFVHNVDIITDLPLDGLYKAHAGSDVLATLAVSGRETRRLLRFDEDGLQARVDRREDRTEEARPASGQRRDRAFAGVHVISPRIFDLVDRRGAFSIIDVYLELAAKGERVLPFDIGAARWLEMGNPDRLEAARQAVGGGS